MKNGRFECIFFVGKIIVSLTFLQDGVALRCGRDPTWRQDSQAKNEVGSEASKVLRNLQVIPEPMLANIAGFFTGCCCISREKITITILFYSRKYDGFKNKHIKLKKPQQLQEILDISRELLDTIKSGSSESEMIEEKKSKLEQIKNVLEM